MKQIIKQFVPKKIWAKVRSAKIKRHIRNFSIREVQHNYGGHALTVYLGDQLGEGWYDHDWPEPAEIGLLRQHQLRQGATVFDLGAHQGIVALMLSRAVEPTGKVIALEANSHNAKIADRNRILNGAEQLTVLHAAAGEKSGMLSFNEGLNGQVDDGSGEWGSVEVAAYSVDALTEQYGAPDVLFIDVEGYECHVLRGAKKTLQGFPDCYVEVHTGAGLEKAGGSAEAVISFFPPEQYELYVWSDETPVCIFTIGSSLPSSRFFLAAVRRENAV